MWLRDGDTLVAALLGPCILRTTVAGQAIEITQDTTYPAENTVRFTVEGARDGIALRVRRPAWATHVDADITYTERDGFVCVTIPPGQAPRRFTLTFGSQLTQHRDAHGHVYFTDGPCVLARLLPAQASAVKSYGVSGFADQTFTTPEPVALCCPDSVRVSPAADATRSWHADLVEPRTRQPVTTLLVPMAHTILRQVTFPPAEHDVPSTPPPQ